MNASNIEEVGQFIVNAGKCALISNVDVSAFSTSATKGGKGEYEYAMTITPAEIDCSVFLNKKNVPTEETVKNILGLSEGEGTTEKETEE